MDAPLTLRFLTAGESHGPALVAILEGMPAGLPISGDLIDHELARRQRGYGAGPRMKMEQDHARLLAGVMEGETTGAPIALYIENRDYSRWRGKSVVAFTVPRPGHADLTGTLKYGYSDLRPALERASARETAARVAMGAICKQLLSHFNIFLGGYVTAIGEITANLEEIPLRDRLVLAEESEVRCPNKTGSERMRVAIRKAIEAKDTLGGVIEVVALGLPSGLGSFMQWDRRLEARLGAAVLSVQAIKGVEIGNAFEVARLPGTLAQDGIRLENGELVRKTNRAGGLEGGVTNGQPLIIRAAMKPIATTLTPQHSVDLAAGEEVDTNYERSDFCPVPRAVVVLEAMVAYVLTDALLEKVGGDSMDEMRSRVTTLRKARMEDINLDGNNHVFWPADTSE